jgi:hypothetical protein
METIYDNHVTVKRVRRDEVNLGANMIMQIPVRNKMEADLYFDKGVAVYEKEVKTSNGKHRIQYFVEVSVYDLAEIARKE